MAICSAWLSYTTTMNFSHGKDQGMPVHVLQCIGCRHTHQRLDHILSITIQVSYLVHAELNSDHAITAQCSVVVLLLKEEDI